jgi:thiamine biosynthesis lipoprotein
VTVSAATAPTGAPMGTAPATLAWEALGTSIVMRVGDPRAAEAARAAVAHELDAIDLACSRFRADSELMLLNARAGRPTRVGPLLLEALELALRAAALTDGDVDPTVGRALELIGYDRDWRELQAACATSCAAPAAGATSPPPTRLRPRSDGAPAGTPRILARAHAGWRGVRVEHDPATVTLPRGVRLDLGATAKAWAADRAAEAAARAGGCGALVAVGGDVACAGATPAGGWPILVTDDHRDSGGRGCAQVVTIFSGGLATSSTTVRRWRQGGRERHHIVDPRSGEPAQGRWRTVSVAAASCADANIASTAAIIRDGEAPAWLAGLGLPTRLVSRDGRTTELSGWPAP